MRAMADRRRGPVLRPCLGSALPRRPAAAVGRGGVCGGVERGPGDVSRRSDRVCSGAASPPVCRAAAGARSWPRLTDPIGESEEPVRSLAEVVGQELQWVRPSARRKYDELRSGEETVATLRWQKGSLAVAEVGDGRWTFKRQGFWRQRVTVRREGSDVDIAGFRSEEHTSELQSL